MNSKEVAYRADWTVKDYIEQLPDNRINGVVIMVQNGGLPDGQALRLFHLDVTISPDRAMSTWFMVEASVGEFWALRIVDCIVDPKS